MNIRIDHDRRISNITLCTFNEVVLRFQVLYVLHLHQESDANTAHVSSISEFMLAHPCLSFSVLDAARRRFKKVPGHDDLGDVTTGN